VTALTAPTAPVDEKLPTPLRRLGARTAEEWISLVRVIILLTLILALSLGIIPINHPTVHTTVALVGVYVLLLALGPRWFKVLRKADLIIALDILVVTLVVIISGSLSSPFIYLYYLTILEAAARLNLRQAIAASLAMAGMIILLWTRAGQGATLETAGFRLGVIIAGGFFMALFLGMLVQEYRIAAERARWTELLDQRLQEATGLLEEQLRELRFYNELASRLSGELRVDGVLEILLQVFMETTGLAKGAAYVIGEDETPRIATSRGFEWAEGEHGPASMLLPALPAGATGGEVVTHRSPIGGGQEGLVASVPLIRAGSLRGWLCGLGGVPESFAEPVLRRVRGLAAQGVSALEAARLHEEVQRMVGVDPSRSLFPWGGLQKLVADEIRRCSGLLLVFSFAEVQLEDYIDDTLVGESDKDLALRRAIKLIQTCVRRIDVIAHDGAGRFAILLPRVAKMDAVDILQRLTRRLEEDAVAAQLLGVKRLMISAAVVTFPEDGTAVAGLFDKITGLLSQGPTSPARVKVPIS